MTAPDRAALAVDLHRHTTPWQARPVKRVYIPKANGKQRPLGIPVLRDRVQQARVANALEPEWEARFEPRSYGFRPGRGCHDAIEAIYWTLKGRRAKRQWILDADLSAAFDRIDHDRLLGPSRHLPRQGNDRRVAGGRVVEQGRFAPTEEGTPQGGVISPMLLNIALHGMEEAAGVRYSASRPPWGARDQGGLAGAGALRRRLRRHVSHQGPGRAGPAPARLSGWPHEALRSTRTKRISSTLTGASTSWGSTSAATAAGSCSSNPARRR